MTTIPVLSSNPTESLPAPDSASHRAYWVLATADVHHYASAWLNRWILCLEASATRWSPGPTGRPRATDIEQRLHGITISACRRTLVLALGGIAPSQMPELMRDRMETREHRQQRLRRLRREELGLDEDTDTDEVPESLAGDDEHPQGPNLIGLGFAPIIKRYGSPWLQRDQLLWEALPIFQPTLLHRSLFPLSQNAFYKSFRRIKDIPAVLTEQDRRREAFRNCCFNTSHFRHAHMQDKDNLEKRVEWEDGCRTLYQLGAEMVLQSYIQEIFGLLIDRVKKCNGLPNSVVQARQWLLEPLNAVEAEGCCGLSYAMIQRITRVPPRIVGARPPRASEKKENIFSQYQDSGLWLDRIRGLFLYDDLGDNTRRWDTCAFRTLTRHLAGVVAQELGLRSVHGFLRNFTRHLSKRLFIIPQYDLDRLSITYKVNKGHSINKRTEIERLNLLEKTSWYLAAFSPAQEQIVRTINDPSAKTKVSINVAQHQLQEEVARYRLEVSTDSTHSNLWLKDPANIEVKVDSSALLEMEDYLNEQAQEDRPPDNNSEDDT